MVSNKIRDTDSFKKRYVSTLVLNKIRDTDSFKKKDSFQHWSVVWGRVRWHGEGWPLLLSSGQLQQSQLTTGCDKVNIARTSLAQIPNIYTLFLAFYKYFCLFCQDCVPAPPRPVAVSCDWSQLPDLSNYPNHRPDTDTLTQTDEPSLSFWQNLE